MSVKIMGMVWDADIDRDQKFVLLAYADQGYLVADGHLHMVIFDRPSAPHPHVWPCGYNHPVCQGRTGQPS